MASFSDGHDGTTCVHDDIVGKPLRAAVETEHSRFGSFTIELHLPVARFLSWHDACAFWSSLYLKDSMSGEKSKAWRMLVAAIVHDRGHDNAFLADLSVLREVHRFKTCSVAYNELFPDTVKHAFAHIYPPERILESIFPTDDAPLLQLVMDKQKRLYQPLKVDIGKLSAAIDHGAKKCLQILLAASVKPLRGCDEGVLSTNCPPWQPNVGEDETLPVDFGRFPMCLLWRAAAKGNAVITDIVLCHLLLACGAHCANDIRLWAACSGATWGNENLLSCAGEALLSDRLSRVSFSCPTHGKARAMEFNDTPLAVVAASCGHASILKMLAEKGVDLQLCNRRGLSVWDAARQHPVGTVRDSLIQVLRVVDPARSEKRSDVSTCSDPLQVAVEAADVHKVRSLISRGAQLEGSDIMSAVRSGDLDMLALVQQECHQNAGTHAEYRKMVKATAAQIRIESRARHSLPKLETRRDHVGHLQEVTPSRSNRLSGARSRSASRTSTEHEAARSGTPVLPRVRPDSRGSGQLRQAGDSMLNLRQKLGR